MRLNQMRTPLTIVVLAVLMFSGVSTGEIKKTERQNDKQPSRIDGVETKEIAKKIKTPPEKTPDNPKAQQVSPAQITPAQMKPADRQMEPLSASAADDKGRQIKWQLVCVGAGCGDNQALIGFGQEGVAILCGSVGQVAVGHGSSPSFGINQGYWQETIIQEYLRGDANQDGIINVGDIVYLVSYLYKNGPAPAPVWVGDCNCDEIVNVGDVVFLVSYLYKGGPEPSC